MPAPPEAPLGPLALAEEEPPADPTKTTPTKPGLDTRVAPGPDDRQ